MPTEKVVRWCVEHSTYESPPKEVVWKSLLRQLTVPLWHLAMKAHIDICEAVPASLVEIAAFVQNSSVHDEVEICNQRMSEA